MPWPDAKTYTEKVKMQEGKPVYEIGSRTVQVGSPEDKDVKENGVAHFLTNPTRETPNAYQIGSISIPKGDPPSDKQLKAFQEAQLAIGGSEKQIDILTRAQIGILPAAYERAHPTPAEFLKKVQIDPKTGDASVGNLHFGASDWPAYKDMILNNGSKDPQLMGSLEKLANSQNSETTLGESVISKPNPSGEHLLANFRPDEHGDMHYKNATIRKEDYPLLAESLTKSPKDVAFIEAEANKPAPHVVEVPRDERTAAELAKKIERVAAADKDPETQRVLENIPDSRFGNLAKKNEAVEKELLTDKDHVNLVLGADGKGAIAAPGFSTDGSVNSVSHNDKSGFTTVHMTDGRGNPRDLSYKEPLGEDRNGDPIHNPLHKLEALEKGNQFAVSVGSDGKSGTLDLPGLDGKPVEVPIGHAPPPLPSVPMEVGVPYPSR